MIEARTRKCFSKNERSLAQHFLMEGRPVVEIVQLDCTAGGTGVVRKAGGVEDAFPRGIIVPDTFRVHVNIGR